MRETVAGACEGFGRVLGWIGICIMGLLAFPVAWEAVARFSGHPTIWVFETSLYALIVAAFLANGLAFASGAHFRITFLSVAFPAASRWLDRLALVVLLLFSCAFVYAASQYALYSLRFDIRSNTLLSVPEYLPQLALPIGGLALALQTVAQLLRDQMPADTHGEAIDAMIERAP